MSRLIRRIFDRATRTPSRRVLKNRPIRTAADLRARLLLQPLEDRMVPNAYTVNLLTDSASGSGTGTGTSGDLRYCITKANANGGVGGPDTIQFAAGLTGIIALQAALPNISDPGLTITGPGAALVTVARGAGPNYRIFNTQPGNASTITMSGLTVSGGNSGTGAGINVTNGNLTLTNMVISGNSTTSIGAGVYNAGTGTLTITGSTIANNSSSTSGGGVVNFSTGTLNLSSSIVIGNIAGGTGNGGGVGNFNTATVTLTGDTITGNRAASGGGVFGGNSTTFTITSTTIAGNSATTTGSNGGGGGLKVTNPAGVTLTGSTLSGNTTASSGGGLYLTGTVGAGGVTISNSTLANNTAVSGGGAELSAGGSGTHLYTLTSDTISGNTANSTSGTAGTGGGGISMLIATSATLNLDNVIDSGNFATNGFTDISTPASGYTLNASYTAISTTNGTSINGTNSHNQIGAALNLQPLGNNGGLTQTMAILPFSQAIDAGDPAQAGTTDERGNTRPQGAAVDIGAYEFVSPTAVLASAPNVTPANAASSNPYQITVTYYAATAVKVSSIDSSDITVAGPAGAPAVTVSLVPGSVTSGSDTSPVSATYQFTVPGGWAGADVGTWTISLAANQVFDSANTAAAAGPLGSFQVVVPRTLTVTGTGDTGFGSAASGDLRYCITTANADGTQAAADTIQFAAGVTGTIALQTALPTITDPGLTIIGPGAALLTVARGTGTFRIFNVSPGAGNAVSMSGLTVSGGNSGTGAGINEANGDLTLTNMVVQNNISTSIGAGVYNASTGTLTITGSTIANNSGNTSGGGVANFGNGILNLTNSVVSGNSSGANGGGVGLFGTGTNTLSGDTITGNRAGAGAGIFGGNGSSLAVTSTTLAGNTATTAGGGISVTSPAGLTLTACTLSGDSAGSNGGGLYVGGTVGGGGVTIINSTLANNTATNGGGVELNDTAGSNFYTLTSDTISGNTANSTNFTNGAGGGGLGMLTATALPTVSLDNVIVSGNVSNNGFTDISMPASGYNLNASYSAIGVMAGYSLTTDTNNLSGANLNLQPLANNGGPTQTMAILPISQAIDAGDPAQAGTTDERGNTRPQGAAVDIGAYEFVSPTAVLTSAPAVTSANAASSNPYQLTVTYYAATAVKVSSIGTGDIMVAGPVGAPAVTVTLVPGSVTSGSDTSPVSASYQFTVPGGWAGTDDGTWTVSLAANQVFDSNSAAAAAGPIGSFLVQLPRTLTVTGTGDAGVGSGTSGDLRYCITTANADGASGIGDTIQFAAGVTGTIALQTALPTITDPGLTITGPGAGSLTVSRGTGTFRIFNVSPGAGNAVTMSGLTVSGGNSGTGAGIDEASGDLNLTNMVIQNNNSGSIGAGVYNGSTGTLTITGSMISGNSSGSSGGGVANFSTGAMVLTNSMITGNISGANGGGVGLFGTGMNTLTGDSITGNRAAAGGGVFGGNYTVFSVTGTTISGNSSTGAGAGLKATSPSSLTVTGSTLSGNSAGDTGGGLYINANVGGGVVTVSNTTIANNTAVSGGGAELNATGASYFYTLTSDTISGNSATSTSTTAGTGGGGISMLNSTGGPTLTLDNTIVSGNSATAANGFTDLSMPAGGLALNVSYSAIGTTSGYAINGVNSNNLSSASSTPAALLLQPLATNAPGTIQTIAIAPGSSAFDAGDPTLAGQTDERGVSRPQANGVDIGAYELIPGIPAANLTSAPNVTAANAGTANPYQFAVTYTDSTAIKASTIDAGDVTVAGPAGAPAVTVTLVNVSPNSNTSPVVATYQFTVPGGWTGAENGTWTVTMVGNQVSSTSSVAVPAGTLGAFTVAVPETLTVTATTDSGAGSGTSGDLRYCITRANTDGLTGLTDTIVFSASTAGGAVNFADGGSHTINLTAGLPTITDPGLTITGPGAAAVTVAGGAGSFRIFNVSPGAGNAVAMSGMTVSGGNTGTGAGINEANGDLTLTNMVIQNNSSTSFGAGVFNGSTGTLTITGSTISGNSTSVGGGGVVNYGAGAMFLTNCTISGNTSGGNGGGVANFNPGTDTLTGDTITGNRSVSGGGIFGGNGSTWTIGTTTIAGNTATSGGGGMKSTNPAGLTITASTLAGNTTAGIAGGLYVSGAVGAGGVTISNTTLANNTAVSGGGVGLGNLLGTITLTSDTITANTATNANAVPGLGGGGIDVASVNLTAGQSAVVALDNSIVSGNRSANGTGDIAAVPAPVVGATVSVAAQYSAIGNAGGYILIDGGNNLIGYTLLLGPLGNNGGPTATVPVLAASPLLGVGDPSLDGTTDQRGVSRPQGMGPGARPDIGAYERTANTIGASAAVLNVTAANPPATYTFTVTYADDVPINVGSIDAGDVTITTPAGVSVPTVGLVSVNSSNPIKVIATYQFTAPGGAWTAADGGLYTVVMGSNQVTDANGAVPAGPLAVFQVAVPTTFVVTNTNDDTNPGSLRYAIAQANAIAPNPALIVFNTNPANGTDFSQPQTIALTTSLPTVATNLTISGPGQNLLTIASGGFQVLSFNPGTANAGQFADTVSGLTLSGANTAVVGAAVSDTNAAALTLANVVIQNNNTSTTGGALNVASSGTSVTITGSTIQNNSAGGTGGGINVAAAGTAVTISNSVIQGNTSGVYGGGVYVAGSCFLTITGSNISGNSSVSSGGGIGSVAGGGLITITGSTINGNVAGAAGGGNGGGIGNFSTGPVTLVNDTITGNSAGKTGGGFVNSNGNVIITGTTISGNSAANSGGGFANYGQPSLSNSVTITGSTISGNTAASITKGGGGVYFGNSVGSGGFTISNTTIANNTALNGGGIDLNNFGGTLTLTSASITGNTATNPVGGYYGGGGVASSNILGTGPVIALDNTIVSGNSAVNGNTDVSTPVGVLVTATYSALGSSTGYALIDLGHNLAIGASLNLLSLANNGGPTQTVALGAGSAAIDAGDPALTGTTDQRGVARPQGAGVDIGAFELAATAPAVGGVVVNNGQAQISSVTSIQVTFNSQVTLGSGAFTLTRVGLPNGAAGDGATLQSSDGSIAVATQVVGGVTVATLTFSGPNSTAGSGSLDDGNWTLTVHAAAVTNGGTPMAGDFTQTNIKRLYGDFDGNGVVNAFDFAKFRLAYGSSSTDPAYVTFFDYDANGAINAFDFAQFRLRYGSSV